MENGGKKNKIMNKTEGRQEGLLLLKNCCTHLQAVKVIEM